jgi:hypothetical protein
MRTLFTIVALVLALAVVGLLARQQLSGSSKSSLALPSAPGVAPHAATVPAVPPAQQVQQVQQAVEALVQQPRRLPDDSQ